MDKRRNFNQKGQTLVIVALLLAGLMAMLGLVLDGGNMYFQRRQAQLAADAGALAGARAYCITENVEAAVNSGWDYSVNRNGVNNAVINVDGEINQVTVDTSLTFEAFFMGLFGNPQLSVSATATAACTPPTVARNVLPVAWSCRPPAGASDSEACEMFWMDHFANLDPHDDDHPDGECTYLDDPIYIVMDSIKLEEEIACQPDNDDPLPSTEDVIYINCDTDGDGQDDLAFITGGNRSWLNLDGDTGNANELKDWVENGYDEALRAHTWLPATTGNITAVYNEVHNIIGGPDVIVPVFNEFCAGAKGVPSALNIDCEWHDGQDDVVTSNGNPDYVHIISFSLFRITCVDAGSNTCEALQGSALDDYFDTNISNSINTIEGCFVDGFDSNLGSGGGFYDTGALIVHLIH